MKLLIELECNNRAFDGGDCGYEVARILDHFALKASGVEKASMVAVLDHTPLVDCNGNRVGKVRVL